MPNPKGIRGLDTELYRKALAEARRKDYKNVGQWINEAIQMRLDADLPASSHNS